MTRSFTITNVSTFSMEKGGRFISPTPASAAKKAGSSICKSKKIEGSCSFDITITETSANSAKKSFTYTFKREYNPKTVTRGDKTITYNYQTSVTSK